MSSMLNSVKNAFKHPEEDSEDASRYGGESKSQGTAATGDLDPDQTTASGQSGGQYKLRDAPASGNVSSGNSTTTTTTTSSSNPVMASVPSTGYVGDHTGGRFPGQGQHTSSTSHPPTGTSQHSNEAHTSSHHGSRPSEINSNNMTQAERESGREGVPGTVTSGDPSMGGKHNSATDNSERLGSNQNTAGVVQNGDPSMGGKYTRAEGINR